MKKILAIDTSSEACSASLIIGEQCKTLFEIAPQGHSELLLPMCSQLLADAQIRLPDLDGLAFSRGPGSFTGLRIGAGVVQGIAFAHDLPVKNISSLHALAYKASQNHPQANILSIIDARMGEVYWAEFLAKNNYPKSLSEEMLSLPGNVAFKKDVNYVAIGSGVDLFKNYLLETNISLKIDDNYSNQLVSAEEIARLAANNTGIYEWVAAEKVLPVYLRNNVVHQPNKKVKVAK